MIFTARKIPILRYGLIVFLTLVLSVTAFYLYIHYTKAEDVRYNFSKVIQSRGNSNLIDSCVISLFNAENNSRMYALTKKAVYYEDFTREIDFVSRSIHTLNARGKYKVDIGDEKFDHLLNQKSGRTNAYFTLLSLTDSLLKTAKKMNTQTYAEGTKKFKSLLIHKISAKIKTDTASQAITEPAKKRKFFSRIFDAFSRKKFDQQLKSGQTKSINAVKKNVDSIIKHTAFADQALTTNSKNYQSLLTLNDQMKSNELELLTINSHLINKIITDLRKYKEEEQAYINNSNLKLDGHLQEVVYDFKKISAFFFVLLTITVALVLYNIWKIFKNGEQLVISSETAEQNAISKTAFLASMSHEIRTPLNSVIGFSEQLMASELSAGQSEQVQAISSSSKMLLEVVNEILDFSKFETGKMNLESVPFNPASSLSEVFTGMRILSEKKGLFLKQEIDVDPSVNAVGDPLRLKQVLINLLNNAIKFTAEGTVLLKAWTSYHDGETVTLNVEIRDSGIGIAKEDLALIFDEFIQVESAQKKTLQKGTGLGLAICKKIIELQGGKIAVSSEAGKGSVFSFFLNYPIAAADDWDRSNLNADDEECEDNDISGKHLLVVDDNVLNLLLVSTILKKCEVTYDTALNGTEALQLFEKNDYDMLLTDIEMPHMGGLELSRCIREYGGDKSMIPILALTANAMKQDTDKYMDAGMNGVIVKPFTEHNLLSQIRKAMVMS